MELDKKTEQKLIKVLGNYFDKKNWTYKHSILSAEWMRKIIKKEGGDEKILVTTMYLHDIGYGKFLKNDYSLDDRLALKKKHMIVGAKLAKKILKRLNYTKKQIKMIAHLIKIHDNMKKIKKKHEIMVMEADSLSQIDHKKLKPSINKKDYMRFLEKFKNVRMSKFKTKTGKQNLKQLLKRINKR